MKVEYFGHALLWLFGAAVALFIFGPGLIGGFDVACWFVIDHQCTPIDWTQHRIAWASIPWGLVLMLCWISLIA